MSRHKAISVQTWKTFLTRIQGGETVTAVCQSLRIDRSSPYRKRDRDRKFAHQWDLAERDSIEFLNDFVLKVVAQPEVTEKYDSDGQLVERIVKPPNIYNVIRVLERRHPHWRPAADLSGELSQVIAGGAHIVDGQLHLQGNLTNGN